MPLGVKRMSLGSIVLVLAFTYLASAQCSGQQTISNSADASALTSCKTFSGSISIATDAPPSLDLTGIETITDALIVYNATDLESLSAKTLEQIGGTLKLGSLPVFTNLDLASLKSVNLIRITRVPKLATIQFDSPLEDVQQLEIEQTAFTSLEPFNPMTIQHLDVWDNGRLAEISMQLFHVTDFLQIEGVAASPTVQLPNLLTTGGLGLVEVSSVDLPSLTTAGWLYIWDNTFSKFSAPKLEKVKSLVFKENDKLDSISMKQLKTVKQYVNIENNTALKVIDGFGGLETVGGSFQCVGDFTELSLPNLKTIGGKMDLESSQNIDNVCNHFKSETGSVIAGALACNGKKLSSASNSGSDSTAGPSNQGSTLSSGAKAGIGIGVALGVLLAVLLVTFVVRKRRKFRPTLTEPSPEKYDNGGDATPCKTYPVEKDWPTTSSNEPWQAELEGSQATKHELQQPPSQLASGRDEPAELSEQHGASELDHGM